MVCFEDQECGEDQSVNECVCVCSLLQDRQEKRPFTSFRPMAAADTLVQDLKWSPGDAPRLAVCLSDGSMMVLDVQDSVSVVAQLPASVGITWGQWLLCVNLLKFSVSRYLKR